MSSQAAVPTTRERPGCVLGIAFGLFVLVGIAAFLWLPRSEARDGTKLLADWFATPPGAPFEVRDAGKLMGGQEVVQLVDASAGPELPRRETPAAERGEDARVDWARVEQGPVERPPRTLTFVSYADERARAERARLFSEKLVLGRIDEVGPQGGRIVLELGTLTLDGWSPPFVIEREFESGGTFRDIARVDLSRKTGFLVLNAIWSRSEPCSKRVLETLVGSLRPK